MDPDAGESTYRSGIHTGTYGALTLNNAGEWTYAAANAQPAAQSLRHSESLIDTTTVTAFDGATTAVTITIAGSNDLPVLSEGIAEVREDIGVDDAGSFTASGTLLVNDPDVGESSYQPGF
jgi:VCBS repeat-containing protein